ncbi:MAG: hypothetical protein K0R71_17 [Bacillales bacterium]|jgi:PBP1b-binding outer membrane lipoprotein LpoB|nr:hypothetical protein [Bacillales bacterium]
MFKRLVSLLLLITLFLSGCSNNSTNDSTPKISSNAKNLIEKVSTIYGEPNPKIIMIKTAEEETMNKPMYVIFLEGNFQKGKLQSNKLEFSMLQDCSDVWALTSDKWQDDDVNFK